jgi:TatA/E family protein of Tat protein translocase
VFKTVVFLILESLGSTELLFILVMALVFFGPRKLPQISRSLGKNLAEFRKASEDFKRTWEREVSLEEPSSPGNSANQEVSSYENSILDREANSALQPPTIDTVAAGHIIPRQPIEREPIHSSDADNDFSADGTGTEPLRKRDWL